MISIILVGRNDNYGGNFEERLFSTTRYNLDALRSRGIETELVFTEWNPMPGNPLLSEEVLTAFANARCVVVDEAIHRLVNQNRHIPLLEFHAKNVGAARANGTWLLLTNADNYFGDDILDFLQQGDFDSSTLYRAGWIDIEDASFVNSPKLRDEYASDPVPHCNASGDFMFCSRTLFEAIGGFREELAFTNVHMDSIFCTSVFERTGQVRKIGNTYHLRHDRPGRSKRRPDYDWQRVSRQPQESFGLTDGRIVSDTHGRLTTLTLPQDLQRVAARRKLPKPNVPWAYRKRGAIMSFFRHPRKTVKRLLGMR